MGGLKKDGERKGRDFPSNLPSHINDHLKIVRHSHKPNLKRCTTTYTLNYT